MNHKFNQKKEKKTKPKKTDMTVNSFVYFDLKNTLCILFPLGEEQEPGRVPNQHCHQHSILVVQGQFQLSKGPVLSFQRWERWKGTNRMGEKRSCFFVLPHCGCFASKLQWKYSGCTWVQTALKNSPLMLAICIVCAVSLAAVSYSCIWVLFNQQEC